MCQVLGLKHCSVWVNPAEIMYGGTITFIQDHSCPRQRSQSVRITRLTADGALAATPVSSIANTHPVCTWRRWTLLGDSCYSQLTGVTASLILHAVAADACKMQPACSQSYKQTSWPHTGPPARHYKGTDTPLPGLRCLSAVRRRENGGVSLEIKHFMAPNFNGRLKISMGCLPGKDCVRWVDFEKTM